MDPLSPIAPARVRCLLLPCGRVTKDRFLEFVKRLQEVALVRLCDVSPSGSPERNTFSPLAFPHGIVIYDFVVSESTPGQKALFPFEIYREPLIVLGLADSSEYNITRQTIADSSDVGDVKQQQSGSPDAGRDLEEAARLLRTASNVTLVSKLLLFDSDGPLPSDLDFATSVQSPSKASAASMRTLMGDLTSELLAEMSTYARSVHSLASVETPKQSLPDNYNASSPTSLEPESKRQSWFQGARSSSPGSAFQKLGQRASLPRHLFQSPGLSPSDDYARSEASSPVGEAPPITFDQMSVAPERRMNQSDSALESAGTQALPSDPHSEKMRNQGRGRVSIVTGQLFLLSGRWPDAMREFIQGGIIARSTNDHIWHAKAVEMILVTLLLCAWAVVEFEIPPLCLPIAERSSVLLGKSKKHESTNLTESFIMQSASQETHLENTKNLANVLPEITQHILRLYTRSTAEHFAQLALSEAFIRLSKLSAFSLLSAGFSESGSLDAVVLNKQLPCPSETSTINVNPSSGKAEIAAIATASIPAQGSVGVLPYLDMLSVYAGVASVLGMLGYHRKKAFLLRDLVGFLLPALQDSAQGGTLSQVLITSPILASPSLTTGVAQPKQASDPQESDGALYRLLALICQTYGAIVTDAAGIPLENDNALTSIGGDASENLKDEGALLAARIEAEALNRAFGSKRLKTDVLLMCISISEVVPDLRGMIAFAASLLRSLSSGIAPGPSDTDGGTALAVEDQIRVTAALTDANALAKTTDMEMAAAEYWDDFIIRDIEILPISTELSLTPRKKGDLALSKAGVAGITQGPFIVNQFTARASTASRSTAVLAADEKFSFAILLQNLYDVNLEIESLEIDAEGAQLDAKIERLTIGPYKTQRLRLVAKAVSAGSLTVKGCKVKVKHCALRNYPIFRDSWRPAEQSKIKRQGLAALFNNNERPLSTASDLSKSQTTASPSTISLKAKVVEPQPLLVLKSMSAPQENVLVLEGERKAVQLTFQNMSQSTVNFVDVSFDDSTLPILQAAVQDRELPAADLYEVEYGMYQKAAISWGKLDKKVQILPGGEYVINVEILGKPGLTSGSIYLDYAALGSDESDNDLVYTRRLPVKFAITVNPSVDLVRNDVFALTSPLAFYPHLRAEADEQMEDSKLLHSNEEWMLRLMRPIRQQLTSIEGDEEFCLLQLDFYNSWSESLAVTPEIRREVIDDDSADSSWTPVFNVTDIILPGDSTRFLVPIPRMALSNQYAPIPSLNPASKRQFVVSSGKISEGYERSSRDAFWHREELLKHIRVKWKTIRGDGDRTGLVELRVIRLTMRMLDALKLETLSARVSLYKNEHVQAHGPSYFKAAVDEFVTVRTTITNHSSQRIYPLVRLQPSVREQAYNVALDLSKKFAFTGMLQQPLGPIEAGETVHTELTAVFLCAGEYEIGASVEEVRVAENVADGDAMSAKNTKNTARARAGSVADLDILSAERTERRIWFSREPCHIDAVER